MRRAGEDDQMFQACTASLILVPPELSSVGSQHHAAGKMLLLPMWTT